jgi:hypothetical protein
MLPYLHNSLSITSIGMVRYSSVSKVMGSQLDHLGLIPIRARFFLSIIPSRVTGCGLDDRGLIPGRGKRFFSNLPHPKQNWSPPAFYKIGTGGKAAMTLS